MEVLEFNLPPEKAGDQRELEKEIFHKSRIPEKQIQYWRIVKKSLDARKRIFYRFRVEVYGNEKLPIFSSLGETLAPLQKGKEVLIVGAGPAGYFAALKLLQLGVKPIVIDRGKDVRSRRKDLRAIQQFSEVNPNSNYCFGEGGAGTYSDGKLYTRSTKKGDVKGILSILVEHGADPSILYEAHPHIGSNKLPKIIAAIRNTILSHGGEIQFNHRLTDLIIQGGQILSVVINDKKEISIKAVILATGHSARDIFYLLDRKKIQLEAKPFAMGVRIEHPQTLIDRIQYGRQNRGKYLPAASYTLTCEINHQGVFSFCMCPGGLIVPAATAPGEIVVNGMSLSRRDSPFANSGLVTAIAPEQLTKSSQDYFRCLDFQKEVEHHVFEAGDGSQQAPAQRVTDFLKGKLSASLPETSYIPGIYSYPVHELLPDFIVQRLKAGVIQFNRKMKGYLTSEAIVVATESRSSSPVKIPRIKDTFAHPQVDNLFPCGEGAGYAGGIMSAAVDGQNVAQKVAQFV